MERECVFCRIARREEDAYVVWEDDVSIAFLDLRPLFPGHTLLIPRTHHETLTDLPAELTAPLFGGARLLARAMEEGLDAQGSFVAINNRVSQSIPHLHIHIVPRRRKDGLKGFFWPRQRYEGREAIIEVQDRLRAAVQRLT